MVDLNHHKVAVLGDGVTGQAVRAFLATQHIPEVSPEAATVVVTSPGIAPEAFPPCRAPVIAEIEWAYQWFQTLPTPPTLIGITGTNGKSTVTAMIGHILQCPCVGNFGNPLITQWPNPAPVLAVELSSYQLEQTQTFRTNIGLFLNLTPDHLQRHKTMAQYLEAKGRLFRHQTPQDHAIYLDCQAITPFMHTCLGQKHPFSDQHPLCKDLQVLPLRGRHNLLNALAAVLAVEILGISRQNAIQALCAFKGLPHRLESVSTKYERLWINDSKGTNPESTLTAIHAFGENPICLILGGTDKGLDLEQFVNAVASRVHHVSLYGEIAPRLQALFQQMHPDLPLDTCDTLDQAIVASLNASKPNHVILFSPACSSFDQFKHFEHRGDMFKQWVSGL